MAYKRVINVDIDGVEKTLSYPELEIKFSGEIDDDGEADIIKIKIFNLSKTTISKIKKEAAIRLQAGHEDNFGTLNIGRIQDTFSYKDKQDHITELHISTDTSEFTNSFISQTFNPPIKASQILNRITPKTALETGIINLAIDKVYQNGKTVYGKTVNVIKQIAKECGTQITISNGKINFTNSSLKKGFVLSSKTGLISSPQKVDKKDSDVEYEIKMIFNHEIQPKSLIVLRSQDVSGNFEVVSAKYNEDFTIDVQLKGV